MKPNKSTMRGFTLIEVMVALVVLSVGLLGIASLYIISLQSGSGAIYRFQAINYASDLADRIRANKDVAATYAAGVGANKACATVATCSTADLAQYDLYMWTKDIQAHLPNAKATITCNPCVAGLPQNLSIEIDWSEGSSKTALSYKLNLQI